MIAAISLVLATATNPIDLGRRLFSVHCVSCHGVNLQGSIRAPALLNVDRAMVDFQLRTGRMPTQAPFEQEFHHPPQFPPDQIAALEAYIGSKSSGSKTLPHVSPPPSASSALLRRGREVYEENCEQCHASTGRGDGATAYQNVAPTLMDADAQTIADAVRAGPDVMPKLGPHVLSDDDLRAVQAYVRYLRTADYNPGGLQLANWGPVSEGFVAWAFGITAILLFMRRIGDT